MKSGDRKLEIELLNQTCGCTNKAWYTLYEYKHGTWEVKGADEFVYYSEKEYNLKVKQLAERFRVPNENISHHK